MYVQFYNDNLKHQWDVFLSGEIVMCSSSRRRKHEEIKKKKSIVGGKKSQNVS